MRSDPAFVAAYLRRLDLPPDAVGAPDEALLGELHARHLTRIPFENLDIHLGAQLSLEPDELAGKILDRGRGGLCYELNGLFARLLTALGYRLVLLGGRVRGEHGFGPPLDHLALDVRAPAGGRWLADVGFGAHSRGPLPWREGVDLADPAGVFRIEALPGGDRDVLRDGVVQYRLEPHPRELADFAAMCWYQQTSPRSHFTRGLVCTRVTEQGRVTLSDRLLITTTPAGRTELELTDDATVLAAYRDHFGITLDRVPSTPSTS